MSKRNRNRRIITLQFNLHKVHKQAKLIYGVLSQDPGYT